MPQPILDVRGVAKTYRGGTVALHPTDLAIEPGEIFALLGPNGAGKTTLISIICGIVTPSAGSVSVAGHDALVDYKAARRQIGLVPQELSVDMFETVGATVRFSRRLWGLPGHDAHVEQVLRDLSLWDKRDARIMELSGGMKRRMLIAKALSHEPRLLFLDEPTAGVDVALRRDMWALVHRLREAGTTVILTTHYIEEAEAMADRVGVIDKGKLLLVENKAALMAKLGKRELDVALVEPMAAVPAALARWAPTIEDGGRTLRFVFDATQEGAPAMLAALHHEGVAFSDLQTRKSSLEDIFVGLVGERA